MFNSNRGLCYLYPHIFREVDFSLIEATYSTLLLPDPLLRDPLESSAK